MTLIDKFIQRIKQQKNTAVLYNPYLNSDLAHNLKCYLEQMMKIQGKRVLLVGEAPGYKGCKHTGIPFTSGGVFQEIDHPLINQLKDKITINQLESENTASIVWRHMVNCHLTPLFWNAFPFHPHPQNKPDQNRAPTQIEINKGLGYLINLQEIYQAEVIAGIGKVGTNSARRAFPDFNIEYIRHPSFGGKSKFITGSNLILN